MKVRRYIAPDMRTALLEARRDQGEDVVILTNRRLGDSVELITADDYDESLLAAFTPKRDAAAATAAPAEAAIPARAEASPSAPPAAPAVGAVMRETLWTRDSVFEQMQAELRSLRDMLQQQFAGLAWGAMGHTHPLWAGLLRRASRLGISARLARQLVQEVPEDLPVETGWRRLLALFARRLGIEGDRLLAAGGIAALVGPTGVGKTTLMAKLAARHALVHGPDSVALISADSQRIAAHEQLRSFGRILGIPVRVAGGAEELALALQAVCDRRLVLVDTAGMNHRDARVGEALAELLPRSPLLRTYVVVSAATQGRDLEQILDRYAPARPVAVMLTKLDETQYLAPALSAAILNDLPVAYVCGGQRIPEDCEPARAHALVSRAVAAVAGVGDDDCIETDLALEEVFGAGERGHAQP
jgi:flagellar biosynthesis protein FlhF